MRILLFFTVLLSGGPIWANETTPPSSATKTGGQSDGVLGFIVRGGVGFNTIQGPAPWGELSLHANLDEAVRFELWGRIHDGYVDNTQIDGGLRFTVNLAPHWLEVGVRGRDYRDDVVCNDPYAAEQCWFTSARRESRIGTDVGLQLGGGTRWEAKGVFFGIDWFTVYIPLYKTAASRIEAELYSLTRLSTVPATKKGDDFEVPAEFVLFDLNLGYRF